MENSQLINAEANPEEVVAEQQLGWQAAYFAYHRQVEYYSQYIEDANNMTCPQGIEKTEPRNERRGRHKSKLK